MEEEKIYLQAPNKKKDNESQLLEGYSGHDWGEKLSFTVGMSYVLGNNKFIFI